MHVHCSHSLVQSYTGCLCVIKLHYSAPVYGSDVHEALQAETEVLTYETKASAS